MDGTYRTGPRSRRNDPMKRMVLLAAVAITVAALAGYFLLHRGTPAFAEPPRDVPSMDGKWIRYSPAFAQRSKLEFGVAESAGLTPVVNVTGTVTFDPERVAAGG